MENAVIKELKEYCFSTFHGGYHNEEQLKIFQHGMQTVINVLGSSTFMLMDIEDKSGHPMFHQILNELGNLHAKKQQDYGSDTDPFANIRDASEFNVEPFRACFVRLNDKIRRLKEFCKKGSLANESVEDSLLDAASYAIIALVLFREQHHVTTNT